MARIRTVKPEFWADEKLGPMEAITRLVFLGLISMADDAGRVIDSVRAIDGFIFPQTEDSASESIEMLLESGRIERGTTASGQGVLQIVHWHHQKIDKPNLLAALPKIAIADISVNARRSLPAKLRDAIFSRDGGKCAECHREVRRSKKDRYDSGPDLAEIDHIIPHIEGGTDDPQNLRLSCLACNRKKAGLCVRRRNADASAKGRLNLDETSPTLSVPVPTTSTNDLTDSSEPGPVSKNGKKPRPDTPKYPHFPTADSARFHQTCLTNGFVVDAGLLRKTLAPLYPVAGPIHPADSLDNALVAFLESRGSVSPDKARFWTIMQFAADVGRWVRLGAMPRQDPFSGAPTERGMLLAGDG